MATKEKEIKLKDATPDELRERLAKNQQTLFKLRFRAATAPVKNTMQIRHLKRDIARIHTFLNQKTATQGRKSS